MVYSKQFTNITFLCMLLLGVAALVFSTGCGSSGSAWKKAQATNTLEAYEEFLKSDPPEEQALLAKAKIDTLIYLRIKQEHSIASYERYIRQFPEGIFREEAQQRLEKLFFYQRAEAENTVNAYDDFLARFPNGIYASEAKSRREQLYFNQQVSKENTISGYNEYLLQYPDGKFVDSANSRIERLTYAQLKATDSVTTYLDYLKRYPDGEFKADALSRIELAAFREANKKGTIDAYETYIRQYPQGVYVPAAKHTIATLSEAYQQGKVVRVLVTQSYYQKNNDGTKQPLTGLSLPIESLARRLLTEHASVTAVGPDAKSYASTLNIQTEALALGKDYGTDTLHFTGASLSGTITLEMIGYPTLKRTFNAVSEPPAMEGAPSNSLSGNSAPFAKAMKEKDSFIAKLLEVLYKVYGSPMMVSALKDGDEAVRSNALDVCGALKIESAFNQVVAALRDNNFSVRSRAALALGAYRNEKAVEYIVRSLEEVLDFDWIKEDSKNLRISSATALGLLGSSRAVKPLINALKDPSPDVRNEAAKSLKILTSTDLGANYDNWSKWYEQQGKK